MFLLKQVIHWQTRRLCRNITVIKMLKTEEMKIEKFTSDWQDRLFSAAANGHIDNMKNVLKNPYDKDIMNSVDSRGWTALMMASRNGQRDAVRVLMDSGCNRDLINKLGQTAYDIASFWGHTDVMEILKPSGVEHQDELSLFFNMDTLDRISHRRKDNKWLQETVLHQNTRIHLTVKGMPVVTQSSGRLKLMIYTAADLLPDIQLSNIDDSEIILIGLDTTTNTPIFNINVQQDVLDRLNSSSKITVKPHVLSSIRDAFKLNHQHASIAGLAASLVDWNFRYKFCATCGSQTESREVGYKRECCNKECVSTYETKNTSYPRLDPTVISAVISPDKNKLLLAKSRRYRSMNMYSCLAGFMEPGESIEAACRREIYEEAGVHIGRVRYIGSQSWPFPTQLMIGAISYATSNDINIDTEELQDARWFSKSEVIQMMSDRHSESIMIPPYQAIAHHLIKTALHEFTLSSKL